MLSSFQQQRESLAALGPALIALAMFASIWAHPIVIGAALTWLFQVINVIL